MMRLQDQPITKDLVAQHNLTEEEFQKILQNLGLEPHLAELEG